jgi:hypothetical protein
LGPAQRPQYISNVLAAFLGPQGLQHPNRLVSGRASYLFMRLVKALRGQLGPYMEMVRCHRSISLALRRFAAFVVGSSLLLSRPGYVR